MWRAVSHKISNPPSALSPDPSETARAFHDRLVDPRWQSCAWHPRDIRHGCGVLGPIVEASEGSSTTIHTIAQQAGSLVWSGVAADAFAESVRAIPIDLAELATAHQTAVRAPRSTAPLSRTSKGRRRRFCPEPRARQAQADSASSRLSSAEGSYTQAEERYVLYTAEADSLEFAKHAADLAGNVAASSVLAQEVTAASDFVTPRGQIDRLLRSRLTLHNRRSTDSARTWPTSRPLHAVLLRSE